MIRKLKSGEYRLYSRKVYPRTGKRRTSAHSGRARRRRSTSARCTSSSGAAEQSIVDHASARSPGWPPPARNPPPARMSARRRRRAAARARRGGPPRARRRRHVQRPKRRRASVRRREGEAARESDSPAPCQTGGAAARILPHRSPAEGGVRGIQDPGIGSEGGIERVAGKRAGGSWSTQDGDRQVSGACRARHADRRYRPRAPGADHARTEPRNIKADRFTIHGPSGMPRRRPGRPWPRAAPASANVQAPQKGRKWG